jgi:hypothetical protein
MMLSIWKFNELDDNHIEVGKEGKSWSKWSDCDPWRDEEMNNCRIGDNYSLLCINFQILHCKYMFSICLFEMQVVLKSIFCCGNFCKVCGKHVLKNIFFTFYYNQPSIIQ